MSHAIRSAKRATCYHCGEECSGPLVFLADKKFCCEGCRLVYEIINKVDLCNYYSLNKTPGISQKHSSAPARFAFLDDEQVLDKLIRFREGKLWHVVLYLPQMHCSSCIWLLENLHRIDPGVFRSEVNFLKKELTIAFDSGRTTLSSIAETLTTIGYEPHISLHDMSTEKVSTYSRARIFRIGIAGFCFANIMMLSFPEYFSLGKIEEPGLRTAFAWINLGLSLPVFFYCASEFFTSAWKGLRQKFLNIDAPIALALLITFSRSLYEIISGSGAGYLDSMSGIVFFMLVGRFFQDKTYNTLTFNRDYTSYFPLGVTVVSENGEERQVPVSKLTVGQRIKVHNEEIIPADAILFMGKARIDYSFVTGESLPVEKNIGEIVYAGGKQNGGALELEVVKEVSQSYLTGLWNNRAFKENKKEKQHSFIHRVSRWFTYALLSVAAGSAVYWSVNDPSKVLDAVTSVLIVACPCALLLSATFTNGSMLRVLQRHGFYVRNAHVLERISAADHIVFDKTGTITFQQETDLVYEGAMLSEQEQQLLRTLAGQSAHPLSKAIVSSLPFSRRLNIKHFRETKGSGLKGYIDGHRVSLGSPDYIFNSKQVRKHGSRVYVQIDDDIKGCFVIRTKYRQGISHVFAKMKRRFALSLISGDNSSEENYLKTLFDHSSRLMFEQSPKDKLEYVRSLQEQGHRVIMVGDGLNDAGALQQSDAGIAVSDNVNNFSPACDAILDGKSFGLLPELLNYCRRNRQIIYASFVMSVLYNIAGLFFAVQGRLEPVIAAILMPLSSLSIIALTTGLSSVFSNSLKAGPAGGYKREEPFYR